MTKQDVHPSYHLLSLISHSNMAMKNPPNSTEIPGKNHNRKPGDFCFNCIQLPSLIAGWSCWWPVRFSRIIKNQENSSGTGKTPLWILWITATQSFLCHWQLLLHLLFGHLVEVESQQLGIFTGKSVIFM